NRSCGFAKRFQAPIYIRNKTFTIRELLYKLFYRIMKNRNTGMMLNILLSTKLLNFREVVSSYQLIFSRNPLDFQNGIGQRDWLSFIRFKKIRLFSSKPNSL